MLMFLNMVFVLYIFSITKSSISNNTLLFNSFANLIALSTFSVHGHLKNIITLKLHTIMGSNKKFHSFQGNQHLIVPFDV